MTARVFVDTNILVYSKDLSEPAKQQIAQEWLSVLWQNRSGRVSYQYLNVYYMIVTQKLSSGLSTEQARSDIRNLLVWKPATVDQTVIENAWTIQDEFGFSWWDALIVSAAQKQDCLLVLSEDMQHEQKIGRLMIVNPFESDIGLLNDPSTWRDHHYDRKHHTR